MLQKYKEKTGQQVYGFIYRSGMQIAYPAHFTLKNEIDTIYMNLEISLMQWQFKQKVSKIYNKII